MAHTLRVIEFIYWSLKNLPVDMLQHVEVGRDVLEEAGRLVGPQHLVHEVHVAEVVAGPRLVLHLEREIARCKMTKFLFYGTNILMSSKCFNVFNLSTLTLSEAATTSSIISAQLFLWRGIITCFTIDCFQIHR